MKVMILLDIEGKAITNERKAVNYHFEKKRKMKRFYTKT